MRKFYGYIHLLVCLWLELFLGKEMMSLSDASQRWYAFWRHCQSHQSASVRKKIITDVIGFVPFSISKRRFDISLNHSSMKISCRRIPCSQFPYLKISEIRKIFQNHSTAHISCKPQQESLSLAFSLKNI